MVGADLSVPTIQIGAEESSHMSSFGVSTTRRLYFEMSYVNVRFYSYSKSSMFIFR